MKHECCLAPTIQAPDLSTMIKQLVRESQGLTNDDWRSREIIPHSLTISYMRIIQGGSACCQCLHMRKNRPRAARHEIWPMDSARADDAIKCRCFSITLSGIAMMWFTRSPSPRSISRFDDLATKFLGRFCVHATHPKDIMSLSSVVQAPGE